MRRSSPMRSSRRSPRVTPTSPRASPKAWSRSTPCTSTPWPPPSHSFASAMARNRVLQALRRPCRWETDRVLGQATASLPRCLPHNSCITTRGHSKGLNGTQRNSISAAQASDQGVHFALNKAEVGGSKPPAPTTRASVALSNWQQSYLCAFGRNAVEAPPIRDALQVIFTYLLEGEVTACGEILHRRRSPDL